MIGLLLLLVAGNSSRCSSTIIVMFNVAYLVAIVALTAMSLCLRTARHSHHVFFKCVSIH